jgi:hypothetical protein
MLYSREGGGGAVAVAPEIEVGDGDKTDALPTELHRPIAGRWLDSNQRPLVPRRIRNLRTGRDPMLSLPRSGRLPCSGIEPAAPCEESFSTEVTAAIAPGGARYSVVELLVTPPEIKATTGT